MVTYISHNLKFYRELHRLTQQEIAEKLETTLGRIKSYEAVDKSVTPPMDLLMDLAGMLDVSLDVMVKVKLTDSNYPVLKRQQVKDSKFISSLDRLSRRLETVEKQVKKALKAK